MTMGFDKTINILNVLQIVVIVPLAWLFMVYLQLEVIGFGIFKVINELIVIAFLLIVWKKSPKDPKLERIDKEPTMKKLKEAFSKYN